MSRAPLTPRAAAFLATLERRQALPVNQVEQVMADQGLPSFAPWLDFHERYSGYVEYFGRDSAIWGLVHHNPIWLAPRQADIEKEEHEDVWYIACADAHPSYSYRLDSNGEFLGTPAQSFDIHIERIALGWDFERVGGSRSLSSTEVRDLSTDSFVAQLQPHRVAEASDKYCNYFAMETMLVVQDAKRLALRSVRVREA